MRYGRNIVRTLLEYYRFTNVLAIPMLKEIKGKKSRPRTYRSRSKNRTIRDLKPRPKTTRTYAPISFTDLTMHYDSSTSNEGSPTRSGFGDRADRNIFLNATHADNRNEQLSMLTALSSKITPKQVHLARQTSDPIIKMLKNNAANVTIPTKPCLTIIDFNQLTRGSLEAARKLPGKK